MRDFLAITGFLLLQLALLALIRVWQQSRTRKDHLRVQHAIGVQHDPAEAGQGDGGPSPQFERLSRGTGPFYSDRPGNAPRDVVS